MEVCFIVEKVRGRPLEVQGGLSSVYMHAEVHFVEMHYGGPVRGRLRRKTGVGGFGGGSELS